MELKEKEWEEIWERVVRIEKYQKSYIKVMNNGNKIKMLLRKIKKRDGRSKV